MKFMHLEIRSYGFLTELDGSHKFVAEMHTVAGHWLVKPCGIEKYRCACIAPYKQSTRLSQLSTKTRRSAASRTSWRTVPY
eukprot:54253-Eustigmatos_ZCMA.PRE.1